MNALPTITPSTPNFVKLLTCSAFDIPNPIATGIFPLTFFTILVVASDEYSVNKSLVPVTPNKLTIYRKQLVESMILLSLIHI